MAEGPAQEAGAVGQRLPGGEEDEIRPAEKGEGLRAGHSIPAGGENDRWSIVAEGGEEAGEGGAGEENRRGLAFQPGCFPLGFGHLAEGVARLQGPADFCKVILRTGGRGGQDQDGGGWQGRAEAFTGLFAARRRARLLLRRVILSENGSGRQPPSL